MSDKRRIDVAVYELGLCGSREKAKALVMAGQVYIDGQRADKPSQVVPEGAQVTVSAGDAYVSRGGHKLIKAIESFGIDLAGKVCIDVGASTGGFTDCMLQNGANFVYAVDVGYGQLAWKLRQDERVCVMERTNARYLEPSMFDKAISFASVDVSFISLRLILPALQKILTPPYTICALIKPQFEAGRGKVGKKGVVRDPAVHGQVIADIIDFAQNEGFTVCGLTFSPIKGPEGNIEYLVCLTDTGQSIPLVVADVVQAAQAAAK